MGNGFNPLKIIQAIRSGKNPQEVTMQIVKERLGSTPFGQNLVNLAENNQTGEIEQIARNICQQRGVDFDKAFGDFKDSMGIR